MLRSALHIIDIVSMLKPGLLRPLRTFAVLAYIVTLCAQVTTYRTRVVSSSSIWAYPGEHNLKTGKGREVLYLFNNLSRSNQVTYCVWYSISISKSQTNKVVNTDKDFVIVSHIKHLFFRYIIKYIIINIIDDQQLLLLIFMKKII